MKREKKALVLGLLCCFLLLLIPGPGVSAQTPAPAYKENGDISTTSIVDETVPMAQPVQMPTLSVASALMAVAALVVAVVSASAVLKNRHRVAFKALAVLLGAFALMVFFLTNNIGGQLEIVNYTTLPIALILLVQGTLALASLRKLSPEEAELLGLETLQ